VTPQIALVLLITAGALVLFALERYPVDFVALGILALFLALGAAGVLDLPPEEALSGFSNPATITVLAMFVLSAGVYRTGAVHALVRRVAPLAGTGEARQLLVVGLVTSVVSAFINNTAAVAILIPMVNGIAQRTGTSASRLLIPLSYFSQLAGVTTLIGTSTSILGSTLAQRLGLRGYGMFEFTHIGVLILAVGTAYLVLVGRHLLPRRAAQPLEERYRVAPYLAEVLVRPGSPLHNRTLAQARLGELTDVTVLAVERRGVRLPHPVVERRLLAGDVLFVHASAAQLLAIRDEAHLEIASEAKFRHRSAPPPRAGHSGHTGGAEQAGRPGRAAGETPGSDEPLLMEVIVAPDSPLVGATLVEHDFRGRYGCTVLAVRKHGQVVHERLRRVRFAVGDALLIQGDPAALERLRRSPGFIVAEQTEQGTLEVFRRHKIPVAVGIVAGVVLLAALGIQPIMVAALEGCVLMVLTGCLKPAELHAAIRWDVVFLLAGVVPLGIALERSGGTRLLADATASLAQGLPAVAVLALFYAVAMLLTAAISNNATVLLLVPVAASTTQALGIDPRAVILAVMFSSSLDFSTPVGYQTNTMVYGLGGYRFADFVRAGGPLNLLLCVAVPIFIALLWR
jgi:di/tricarboxylate transporter